MAFHARLGICRHAHVPLHASGTVQAVDEGVYEVLKHWMKGTVSDETNPHCSWHTNAPDYTGLGPEAAPGRWRHSIAVKKGRVLEQRDDEFSARWLWMGEGNRPNPERGYMRRILKAYTVTPKRAARKQMQVRDTDRDGRSDARKKRRAEAAGGECGAKRARH